MLYYNYFRYFEDQIPDRIFLKVVLSARIFHVATRLENVRQELEARSRIRMEKKRGKNLQEKNLRNIQNSPSSLSFHFFFISSLSSLLHEKLKISRSSKRSYLILFLLQRFVNPHFSLSSSYIICIMN